MIIFYSKSDGKIIASFPEIYNIPEKVKVTAEGKSEDDFNKLVISPEDAKEFEDPRNPKNIHDYIVRSDSENNLSLTRKQ